MLLSNLFTTFSALRFSFGSFFQEGFRYNALHVAAMKNQPESAQLILDTIQNPRFMELLYPGEPEQTCDARMQFLVDLYLNTPDKGVSTNINISRTKFKLV